MLEHTTTADAVEAVRSCGETVVATITAHHLSLLVDDWAGNVYCFCKPVAKVRLTTQLTNVGPPTNIVADSGR